MPILEVRDFTWRDNFRDKNKEIVSLLDINKSRLIQVWL
tara:strand:+ start:146 stop:262 length:117 start_codon:yes stop_codon:yes gene_type:complete